MKRRSSLKLIAFGLPLTVASTSFAGAPGGPFFGCGVKVGEATSDSAVLWTRLCSVDQGDKAFQLPGVAGKVRVKYAPADQPEKTQATAWKPALAKHDYTVQCALTNLSPGTKYAYVVEAEADGRTNATDGTFQTAPESGSTEPIRFVVTTCHAYETMDVPGRGVKIYPSMLRLEPQFFVHTGDNVYYDRDVPPLATNAGLARLHWHRMANLPLHRQFHRNIASYFIKDDHDVLKDDAWPGQKYHDLTFEEGQAIMLEQTPHGELPYRTVRWGKDLQIWLMEGRDFRDPNRKQDGPDKSIWGDEQWNWLQETVDASDATFHVLISPTPIVGPDRPKGKRDNHSNAAWRNEGDRVRQFIGDRKNMFVICGDRHWQFFSIDSETKVREFGCGPSTDQHAGGWDPNNVLPEHQFLRVQGGFLSVETSRLETNAPRITFRHHDVDGEVVHEAKFLTEET
ncbi:alkaline phosphatase D family protein [Blastopirellula sp. J2-11]|uniref:alkaline phosphatase D family protein n=1 Tax=Blastopirellula sp. J2-11 TaxID=2943192 RepID=UPI0021C94423|nr:alkaline phosphatase D family protein [Blastopirellula sp. J2-11]UUO07367.1 alkaline phosphatase D family protein [Blastopirellula sp. J2-11]